MKASKLLQSSIKDLDSPVLPVAKGFGWFKKNKIRIFLVNEDGSVNEYFLKLPDSYVFDIKKRSYALIGKCVLRGQYPTMVYFFNNPMPILFKYQSSKLTAQDLRSDNQLALLGDEDRLNLAHVHLDSESLNLAFNSRVMRGLYASHGVTAKTIIIILVVVAVIVLIILHVTGVVDVWGALTGASYVRK